MNREELIKQIEQNGSAASVLMKELALSTQEALQIENLYPNDVIDADKITYRELMFTGAKTSGTYTIRVNGKYLNVRREVDGITTILNSNIDTYGKLSVVQITAVAGAKYYIEGTLTEFYCNNNQLTALDVSKCTALTYLDCSTNQLIALDVSKCTALTYLDCINNQLIALDVSKCAALTYLDCSNNQLAALDVSKCAALYSLYCDYNQLTVLDVSKCTELLNLQCSSNNRLTTLDVSKCTALEILFCDHNQLTVLDVSKCINLSELHCENNTENLVITWMPNPNNINIQLLSEEAYSVEAVERFINALPNATSCNAYILGYTDIWDELDEAINNALERGWEIIDGEY